MPDYEEDCLHCFQSASDRSPEAQLESCGRVIAASRDPEHVERAHFMRGLLRVDFLGDLAGALRDYDRVIERTPSARHLTARGDTLAGLGRIDEAMADYTRAIALDSSDSATCVSLGYLHASRGQHARAIECYDQAIARGPYAAAYYARHLSHAAKDDWSSASSDIEEAIRLDPTDPVQRVVRGLIRFRQGDHSAALADFDKAFEVAPDVPSILYCRGVARLKCGDAAGEADVAQAQALEPSLAEAMRRLGIGR